MWGKKKGKVWLKVIGRVKGIKTNTRNEAKVRSGKKERRKMASHQKKLCVKCERKRREEK